MVNLLRGWDRQGRFEFIPFQHPSASTRFPWISAESFKEAMQLVARDGQTWAGAAAIERMLGLLPAGWLFGWAFRVPLLGPLLDRAYRWFARNRYRLGCADHCGIPSGPAGAAGGDERSVS